MSDISSKAYNFSLVNAFSGTPFGGNPAVVIFLDTPLPTDSLYLKIAQNFNQPIACFVFPADDGESEPDETTVTFRIRWFTMSKETALCGHGTLAAAHAILAHQDLVPPHTQVLRFKAMYGYVYARRIQVPGAADRIEIELPAFDAKPVEDSEFARVRTVVSKAFRRDVSVKYIGLVGSGEPGSGTYVLIELDENEVLQTTEIDISAFAGTAPFSINTLTVKSRQPGVAYEARMFAPLSGVLEDQVCGSANCLMAPYWANKLSIACNEEMVAKFVSPRGGVLWVTVDREKRKVHLQGEAKLTGVGQIFL